MYSGHVCTENFEVLARATAAGRGSPEHPVVVLPAHTEFADVWEDPVAIKEYARRVVKEIFGE